MVDREDDLRAGSKSTAILFGDMDLVALGVLYGLFFLGMGFVGRQAGLGAAYWAGLGVALALVVHQFVIARHRERAACFRAFLGNHWVGNGGVHRAGGGAVDEGLRIQPTASRASAPIRAQSFAFSASPGTIHEPPTVSTLGSAR